MHQFRALSYLLCTHEYIHICIYTSYIIYVYIYTYILTKYYIKYNTYCIHIGPHTLDQWQTTHVGPMTGRHMPAWERSWVMHDGKDPFFVISVSKAASMTSINYSEYLVMESFIAQTTLVYVGPSEDLSMQEDATPSE